MKQYHNLIKNILANGTRKENRTGIDTISTFNENYEIDLCEGFPLLTTKKISWKNIVLENLWFLSGDNNIKFLQKHGVKFWNPWADKDGYIPSAYGNFWRNFPVPDVKNKYPITGCLTMYNDQIDWVLNELKVNPMSRRLVVSAWAPGQAQTSKLPPCHAMFVFNVQNMPKQLQFSFQNTNNIEVVLHNQNVETEPRLCLHLTQRSADVGLGVPYNIAGYAFILELFSHLTGLKPGIFAHSIIDAHIYTSKPDGSMSEYDHVPGLIKQINREIRPLPRLRISNQIKTLNDIYALLNEDLSTIMSMFVLEGYNPHAAIELKAAV